MKFKAPLGLVLLSGVFFVLDRFLKIAALKGQTSLDTSFIGWEPFMNKGIAFGIVMPPVIIFIFTIGIIFSVSYLFYLHTKESPSEKYKALSLIGLSLVITGAISNLVDRVVYGVTIDYFRVFTSVINLADVLIISGFVIYFSSLKHIK